MLTPFDDQGAIDWGSLQALIDWFLEKGAERCSIQSAMWQRQFIDTRITI
jgi:dihydrodipicolinate synthase/N-acetylneuraminate lyase